MNRSRWLLCGGLLGVFLGLAPNVETATLPRGEQVTVRLGVFPWFRYFSQEQRWSEGKDYRREETGSHLSLVNPSVLAGVVGLGLLAAYWWRGRSSDRAGPPRAVEAPSAASAG